MSAQLTELKLGKIATVSWLTIAGVFAISAVLIYVYVNYHPRKMTLGSTIFNADKENLLMDEIAYHLALYHRGYSGMEKLGINIGLTPPDEIVPDVADLQQYRA